MSRQRLQRLGLAAAGAADFGLTEATAELENQQQRRRTWRCAYNAREMTDHGKEERTNQRRSIY